MTGVMMAIMNNVQPTNVDVPGLRLFLDSGNTSSYSGSGSTWTDLSGYDNNGTLVNSPTYITNNYGVLDFNGTTQYATVSSTITPSRTEGFSFNVWVNFDDLTGWQTFIGQDTSNTSVPRAAYYFQKATNGSTGGDGTSNTVCIKIVDNTDTTIYAEDTTTVTTGVWYNYVGTVSSTALKLYKNGVLVSTTNNSTDMIPATGNIAVAAGYYGRNITDYVNGKLPVAQYYNKVLSDSEVSDLYEEFSYRYISGSPYFWYDPSSYSGSGTVLPDLSGNNRDATISGSPAYNTDYFTFDGTNDYIVSPNFYHGIDEAHTIEVWIYPTTTNTCLWSQLSTTTPNDLYHFASGQIYAGPISNNTIISGLWNGTSVSRVVNGVSLNFLNNWQQVAFTYNGTTLTPYLNGVSGSSITMNYDPPYATTAGQWYLAFGARDDTEYTGTTAGWYAGRYGVIRVYSTALTGAQILANYNATKSIYGL